MKEEPKAVILANGTYPQTSKTRRILEKADYIICCDGAANYLIPEGIIPQIIVGDGDSLSKTISHKFSHIVIINPDQETNDLTKAVTYAESHNFKNITILGATGKREDHTLGNISLLSSFNKELNIKMITEYGTFYRAYQTTSFDVSIGLQISIFNVNCSIMKSQGLKFPIRPFKQLWEGTLNESSKEKVVIEADGDYLIYITHSSK